MELSNEEESWAMIGMGAKVIIDGASLSVETPGAGLEIIYRAWCCASVGAMVLLMIAGFMFFHDNSIIWSRWNLAFPVLAFTLQRLSLL